MHIDKLLKREDFLFIFKKTLEKYFENINEISIHLVPDLKKNQIDLSHYFYVFPKLNIIFPVSINSNDIYPYIEPLFNSKNKFKLILQNIYFKFQISKIARKFFASNIIYLSISKEEKKDKIFLGGNHTISLINLKDKTSNQILKYNYNRNFIRSAIKIRTNYPDLPTPKLLSYSLDKFWIKQEWVRGIPINRLSNKIILDKTLDSAIYQMLQLYKKTAKKEKIVNWFNRLSKDLKFNTTKLSTKYDDSFKNNINYLISQIIKKYLTEETFGKEIFTALTHGDFSGSNIFYTEDKNFNNNFFLIDWDFASRRFVFYDFLVYKINARSVNKIADNLFLFSKNLIEIRDSEKFLLENYCKDFTRLEIIAIFLLEDINVRIKDNLIPFEKIPNPDLIEYFNQLSKFILLI